MRKYYLVLRMNTQPDDPPDYTLSVNNPDIWRFFQTNHTLSFETCVLLTVQLLDAVIQTTQINTTEGIYSKVQTQILTSLQHIQADMQTMHATHGITIAQIKADYSTELKRVAESIQHHHVDVTRQLIQDATDRLIDKMHVFIGESVPQNITEQLATFRSALYEDTSHMIKGQLTPESLALFLERFESKTTQLLQSAQQPIYTCLNATESRLRTDLKSIHTAQQLNQPVYENMTEFLNRNKYKNSSAKGRYGEVRMEEMLNTLYPTAEIVNTTGIPNSGDFYIGSRGGTLPDILVETKEYTRNVSKDEVDKFVRDVIQQRRHGVMISHTSGIAGKRPFEIEVHQQWVVVYVASAAYAPERMKIATDMIDSLVQCLSPYFQSATPTHQVAITPAMVSAIQSEYNKFIDQKLEMINQIKLITADMQRALLAQMNTIQFPELAKFVDVTRGVIIRPPKRPVGGNPQYKPPTVEDKLNGEAVFTCTMPGCTFRAKSNRGLLAHQKKCKLAT